MSNTSFQIFISPLFANQIKADYTEPINKMSAESQSTRREFLRVVIPSILGGALLVIHGELTEQPNPLGDPIPTAPPASVVTPPARVSTPEVFPTITRIQTPRH